MLKSLTVELSWSVWDLVSRASHLKIEGDLKIDRAGLRRRSVRDRPRELSCTAYFVYCILIAAYHIVRIAAYYIILI